MVNVQHLGMEPDTHNNGGAREHRAGYKIERVAFAGCRSILGVFPEARQLRGPSCESLAIVVPLLSVVVRRTHARSRAGERRPWGRIGAVFHTRAWMGCRSGRLQERSWLCGSAIVSCALYWHGRLKAWTCRNLPSRGRQQLCGKSAGLTDATAGFTLLFEVALEAVPRHAGASFALRVVSLM